MPEELSLRKLYIQEHGLERACIASERQTLLTASASTILRMWNEAKTVRGGTEWGIFSTLLKKEVVAQLIALFTSFKGGFVFGSWVKTRNNGMQWTDIDVSGLSNLNGLILFISMFIEDINSFTASIEEVTSSERYVSRAYILYVDTPEDPFDIKIDVAGERVFLSPTSFMPVTYGSCLSWSADNGFQLREGCFLNSRRCQFTVDNILQLLRDGKDVKLALIKPINGAAHTTKYAMYYWSRISAMKNDVNLKWRRVDGSEPDRPKQTELDKYVEERLLKSRIRVR